MSLRLSIHMGAPFLNLTFNNNSFDKGGGGSPHKMKAAGQLAHCLLLCAAHGVSLSHNSRLSVGLQSLLIVVKSLLLLLNLSSILNL